MTKTAKCYAKNVSFLTFLRFEQIYPCRFVVFDNKKVCAPEDTHTEKRRPSFATTQNFSLPTTEYAK